MKRKRGHKKGNLKRPPAMDANAANLSREHNSGLEDLDHAGNDSGLEAETTSPDGSDRPDKFVSINSDGLIERPVDKFTYGRVKVKIRTSKTMESHPTSDVPSSSDTEKSNLQESLDKQVAITEKVEDSGNSSNLDIAAPGNISKKTGSIKIKSSRGFESPILNQTTKGKLVQGENRTPKEQRLPQQEPLYSKAELDAALMVIKKVMKMDAAEPFNVPVNPIELGIPDYFDIIDTPMDFGTICNNIENGLKYINSEDVYKDVQYIWENCYKYNNKGDYILELMKRVKKNFSKYWAAAGLYGKQSGKFNDAIIPSAGIQRVPAEDITHPFQGKIYIKGSHSKTKARKHHGVKSHKENCLCAICIMKRRRIEREKTAQTIDDHFIIGDCNLAQEVNQEIMCTEESPCNEDTSSNMGNSLDQDTDADLEEKAELVEVNNKEQQCNSQQEKESQMKIEMKGGDRTEGPSQPGDRSGMESTSESQEHIPDDIATGFKTNPETEEIPLQKTVAAPLHKESLEKRLNNEAFEALLRSENHMVLEMCGILFPNNSNSVWYGPHSLAHQGLARSSSSIHAAISSFMQ